MPESNFESSIYIYEYPDGGIADQSAIPLLLWKGKPMNLLILGDVVGKPATEGFGKALSAFKAEQKVDAVIINGENACLGSGNGISTEAG